MAPRQTSDAQGLILRRDLFNGPARQRHQADGHRRYRHSVRVRKGDQLTESDFGRAPSKGNENSFRQVQRPASVQIRVSPKARLARYRRSL
jgi:hypothetical protein